ncbi:hypothetical protein C7E17_27390, partial [Stenotrophomonas maltophilia]
TGQFDLAADREHPRRCRFDAQPADGETQQLAGRSRLALPSPLDSSTLPRTESTRAGAGSMRSQLMGK